MRPRWRPTPPCARSCAATAARATGRCWSGWRSRAGSRRRRPRTWSGSPRSARPDDAQQRPMQPVELDAQRVARPQHRLDHTLQHRLPGDELADPCREPDLARGADLEAEAAEEAPDALLDVQQLALQELAPDEERSHL